MPIESPFPEYRLFISSPEFTFLQLAATYPLSQAAYYGFALCSSYRIDEWAPQGICLRREETGALTSVAKMRAFLDRIGPVKGSSLARRALGFVRENSFSPMESGLALSLGMPCRHGGFNLGKTTMNPSLKIDSGLDCNGRRAFVVRKPDILIESRDRTGTMRKVAIDYDSFSFHAERQSLLRDAQRRNDFLGKRGMPHFTITSSQVSDFRQYEQVVCQIRRALGKRAEPARRAGEAEADFVARCEVIRRKQFALWAEVVRQSAFRRTE